MQFSPSLFFWKIDKKLQDRFEWMIVELYI